MVSALGLDVVSSCAASRAQMRRIAPLDDCAVVDTESDAGESVEVAAHRVPKLSVGLHGLIRLLSLSAAALTDLTLEPAMLDGRSTGIILLSRSDLHRREWLKQMRADPEKAGDRDLDGEEASLGAEAARLSRDLLPKVATRARIAFQKEAQRVLLADQTGFVMALELASKWIAERTCERCLIGGVDSYLDPATVRALEGLQLLKTPDDPAGLIPGEAACFVAVEALDGVFRDRRKPLATLEGTAFADGASRLRGDTATGDGLSQAIAKTFGYLADGGRATGIAVVNLNGEPHRALEWGHTVVRTLMPLALGNVSVLPPPLHLGEIGAATGPVSVAMLARAWARRYAPSPNALVCLLGDDGARGTFYVRAPAGGRHG
jgi:3-oxoacyl-[acyl-carrier-protein] synthase-1